MVLQIYKALNYSQKFHKVNIPKYRRRSSCSRKHSIDVFIFCHGKWQPNSEILSVTWYMSFLIGKGNLGGCHTDITRAMFEIHGSQGCILSCQRRALNYMLNFDRSELCWSGCVYLKGSSYDASIKSARLLCYKVWFCISSVSPQPPGNL